MKLHGTVQLKFNFQTENIGHTFNKNDKLALSKITLKITKYSIKKRASRATALRADGVWHIMGLVLTPWTSPNPWIRP